MLASAALCVIVTLLSAVMGWSGLAIGSICLAQVLFGLFLASGLAEHPHGAASRRTHARLLPIK